MCYLKMNEFKNAVFASNEALIIEPHNIKANFRRGKARVDNIQSG